MRNPIISLTAVVVAAAAAAAVVVVAVVVRNRLLGAEEIRNLHLKVRNSQLILGKY